MGWYILRRLGTAVVVLWFVTVIAFTGLKLAPGNALLARMSPETISEMSSQQLAQAERALGLDAPFPVQYWRWFDATLHGHLGFSTETAIPVSTDLANHAVPTLILMGTATGLGLLFAIPLGIFVAVRRDTVSDTVISLAPVAFIAVPSFVSGLALIFIFGVHLGWLPVSGMYDPGGSSVPDLIRHLVLPAPVLAVQIGGPLLRYTRASMIESLGAEYIVTANAKGLTKLAVLLRHGFRNALLPIISGLSLTLPSLIGGAVITETVFNWPGMGQLAVQAANSRDMPVMLGVVLLVAVVVVVGNLIADLAYAWADPRVRLG